MKGYAHYIWSASSYVVVMLIITLILFPKGEFLLLVLGFIFTICAIALQTRSSKKERGYKAIKGKDENIKKLKKKMRIRYLAIRETSLILLLIALGLLTAIHSVLAVNRQINFDEALIITGFLLSYVGSVLPDSDLMLGVENHRNKYTHSAIMPSVAVIISIFFTHEDLLAVNTLLFGFTIGVMMHLFCDVVPDGSNVREAIVSFIKWDKSPGDIREIKENKEQLYLIVNGLILGVFSTLLVLRSCFYILVFPPIVNNGVVSINLISIILFVFSMILFIIPFIMIRLYRSKKKK
ncbi:MAG: hypothetical protein ACFFAO_19535 [Candidatus Hermodarchaeota archaeon]